MVPSRMRSLLSVYLSLAAVFAGTVLLNERAAIHAQVTGLPDYAVENLFVAPAVPEAGEEVSFHAQVRNVGQSRGTKRDFVRLWIDQDNNGSWDYMSNLAIVGGLPVGSHESVGWGTTGNPRPIAWPRVAGTHAMKVCLHQSSDIDTDEYQSDVNASNDCATLIFTTVAGEGGAASSSSARSTSPVVLPDFTISTFSMARGPSEGKFSAGVTVKNRGANWNGVTHVILEYHRTGGTAWESIVPARDIPALHNGQEAEASWNNQGRGMSGTAPLASGSYDFRACADAWNLVAESDEKNCTPAETLVIPNTTQPASSSSQSSARTASSSSSRSSFSAQSRASSSRTTNRPLPNLVLRAFRITPRSFAAGGRWGIQASVVNFGGAGSMETDAVLKIDSNNDNRDVLNESVLRVIPPLNANGGKFDVLWSTSADPKIEWTSVPGTHRVGICVNERRQATESNYNDNCAWGIIRVRAAGSSSPVYYNPQTDTPRS